MEDNKNSFASIFAPISNFLTSGLTAVASIIGSNNAVETEQLKLDGLDKQLELAKVQGKNAIELERIRLEIVTQTSKVKLAQTANNAKTFFYIIIFGFLAFVAWLVLKPKKAETPVTATVKPVAPTQPTTATKSVPVITQRAKL